MAHCKAKTVHGMAYDERKSHCLDSEIIGSQDGSQEGMFTSP